MCVCVLMGLQRCLPILQRETFLGLHSTQSQSPTAEKMEAKRNEVCVSGGWVLANRNGIQVSRFPVPGLLYWVPDPHPTMASKLPPLGLKVSS